MLKDHISLKCVIKKFRDCGEKFHNDTFRRMSGFVTGVRYTLQLHFSFY